MEHAQRVYHRIQRFCGVRVLILILMEHAQRGASGPCKRALVLGLNPYFNGTCSKSSRRGRRRRSRIVLILILMEHAQRAHGGRGAEALSTRS